ncbi:MAG: CPBP family intramembrane metalloprotease [Candidatus Coatesbacteria bacterium]|nr:MAG: CPBP family intramembrane metalloprotease [Candidatus Coatesbacteria bacterium]
MPLLTNREGRLRAWVRLALFYGAAAAASLLTMITVAAISRLASVGGEHPRFEFPGTTNPWLLAAAGLVILVPLLAVTMGARKLLDRRPPLLSLGLRPRAAPRGLAWGFVGGAAFLSLTSGILALAGGARFEYVDLTAAALAYVPATLVFFAIAGTAEELLLRGYPITVLDESWGRAGAVLLTAVAFGVLHLLNPGSHVLPAVNVTLAGVILGLLYLQSGSLWFAIGFHGGWNFAEGTAFGFPVSGLPLGAGIVEAVPAGPGWLSGGTFGPEGSVVLTATSAVLIALILLRKIPYPKSERASAAEGRPQ